jgi:hypothetical protein
MMISRNFNRRHSPNRRKTRVAALMELDGARYPVTIRDISFHGMKLAVPVTVEPGSPVSIRVLEQEIPAIVHWCRDSHVGIHLLDRLEGQTLLALENAHDELAAFR